MNLVHQKKIDKTSRICFLISEISAIIGFGTFFLWLAVVITLNVFGVLDKESTAYISIFTGLKIFWGVLACVAIPAVIVHGILRFWATDEEKEEFKRTVKDAVKEIKEEENAERKNRKADPSEIKCPLIDVNDEQKEAIIELLKRRITKHEKDESRFDRSVVYTYLRALRAMHKIEPVKSPDDIDARRIWIEHITNLYEPQDQWAHFRGDYDEYKKNNKVRMAIKEIETEIAKIR